MGQINLDAISAKVARQTADTSYYTLGHIYKAIKEKAHENGVFIYWSTFELSEVVVKAVIDELTDKGFTVETLTDEHNIKVSW